MSQLIVLRFKNFNFAWIGYMIENSYVTWVHVVFANDAILTCSNFELRSRAIILVHLPLRIYTCTSSHPQSEQEMYTSM
jgi:hypothetical protein